ncbi:hypothetical protein [Micromonospora pisi]|nr:hypothetical protein [Micromonospora pisi]
MPVKQALDHLKEAVPFDLFRYASNLSKDLKDKASLVDYEGREVTLEPGDVSLMSHLRQIIDRLPLGWQATVQPQGVIVYRENVDYSYAIDGWRKDEVGVIPVPRGMALPAPRDQPRNDTPIASARRRTGR